ncbi:hypothetical protein CEXT_277621 [Caerostris extrusa]|uniref:Uncharacterized protein n=1 Tax=Caerostris extrusa TaxID=172846 RepID=A0AAV4NWP4_CAEEX|nr:hypothetical protein CEXT_277621 [Caerostris extrusa]
MFRNRNIVHDFVNHIVYHRSSLHRHHFDQTPDIRASFPMLTSTSHSQLSEVHDNRSAPMFRNRNIVHDFVNHIVYHRSSLHRHHFDQTPDIRASFPMLTSTSHSPA